MTIRIKRVDGAIEIIESHQFIVAPPKEMHPNIVEITVFSKDGRKMKHWKRKFSLRYMKTHEFIIDKPVEEPPEEEHK